MTYDLYFHNDFDGWASAAVMLAFFEGCGDRIGHFVPVDHDLQPQWIKEDFFTKHHLFTGKRFAPVVLDFPFHPGAAFWFDHHPAAFKKEAWQKKFHEDQTHIYRPRYFSCCHMVYAMLVRNFTWHPPKYFGELIEWLDIIDGARYASAKQTLAMKEPAFTVSNFIDAQGRNPKIAEWLIRQLAAAPLHDAAKIPKVAAAGRHARKIVARNLAFYRKHLVLRGATTFIDLIGQEDKMLRFAPYYLFPKLRYGVRATMKGSFYHVGVGENPWLKNRRRIHIGRLLKKYGGGGHADAGGVEFKTKEAALRAREEIIAVLNRRR
jgi:hypothetical protein